MSSNSMHGLKDKDLICKIRKDGDNEAYKELCKRYEKVFYRVCQKYYGALMVKGLRPDDVFKDMDYTMFTCIQSFDEKRKTKFSTYLGNYARYLCLNTMNSKKNLISTPTEDLTNFLEGLQTVDPETSTVDVAKFLSLVEKSLKDLEDDRIYDVIKLRHLVSGRQTKWKDIAKKMNISPQTAINLYGKGLSQLRSKIKSRDQLDVN